MGRSDYGDLARRLLASVQGHMRQEQEYRRADAASFPDLDLEFYRSTERALEALGFVSVADIENLSAKAVGAPETVVRAMRHGGSGAGAFFFYIPKLEKGFVDFETLLTNDHFVVDSNSPQGASIATYPTIHHQYHEPDAPLDEVYRAHFDRTRAELARHAGAAVVPLTGFDDVVRAQNVMNKARHDHLESTGWISLDYLRRMTQGDEALAFGVYSAIQEELGRPVPANDEIAGSSFPHLVVARFYEHIEPLDRADRYEDPLAAALETKGVGRVTGGGSQLDESGGIAFGDVEFELADLDDALGLAVDILEKAGAPQGSQVIDPADERVIREFGLQQCLAVFLDGTTLPDEVYQQLDFEAVVGEIASAAGDNSFHGYATGQTETGLFLFGPDAETMLARVEPVLRRLPIGQNARVVVRFGHRALEPREIRIPRR